MSGQSELLDLKVKLLAYTRNEFPTTKEQDALTSLAHFCPEDWNDMLLEKFVSSVPDNAEDHNGNKVLREGF
jgi:hypothetical protein